MGMNSVFMLNLSNNIGGRSEGIFQVLSSFENKPNAEFHLEQIHFPSLIPCFRPKKEMKSGNVNSSTSSFYFLIISDQTKANLPQDLQFLKVGHPELAPIWRHGIIS